MSLWLLICATLALASGGLVEDSYEHGAASVKGPKSTNCTCGLANRDSGRIVGGEETRVNEYPFMAGLVNPVAMIVFCGGAVISQKHVLTAAHCTVPKKQRKFGVTLGDHDVDRKTETEGTVVINVVRTIEHENYNTLAHHNDIAICVLERNIEFTVHVGRVCLPTGPINMVDKHIKVIGWGRTSAEGRGSNVLLNVDLKVLPIESCAKHYPIKMPARQICTYRAGHDSCKGDSGGPLIFLDKETNRYTLIGVVSYGRSCAGKLGGVNTDVSMYTDWISSHIEDGSTCSKQ